MADDVLVRVEGLSKKFCRDLKRSMLYGIQDVGRDALGLPPRSNGLRSEEFWALDDVSFELRRGESLGIIGANGSGKSTLLKVLNGIILPDRGRLTVRGRVGALIELGAGFHPMLTGRENIYVNGAILGLSKREIDARLDEIIEFAGIGEFIDSPIKMYSSGMYARLGFATAVHVEPDVLLVDEVLSVGDMSFQNRCIRRMTDLIGKGRTVVFVSHNMLAVQALCQHLIWLDRGKVRARGAPAEVIRQYSDEMNDRALRFVGEYFYSSTRRGTGEVRVVSVETIDASGHPRKSFRAGEDLGIAARYRVFRDMDGLQCSFVVKDVVSGATVTAAVDRSHVSRRVTNGEEGIIECRFLSIPFQPGSYLIKVVLHGQYRLQLPLDVWDAPGGEFMVVSEGEPGDEIPGSTGLVHVPFNISYSGLRTIT